MHPGSSSQRKLVYAVVVAAGTFVVMTGWGSFIRPYTDASVVLLDGIFGKTGAAVAILGLAAGLLFYGLKKRHDDPPPLEIRKPLWFKIIGGFFFLLPIAGLLFLAVTLGIAYLT